MRQYPFHQIDAFTTTLFGGNPAAIVENAQDLSVGEMANIAREMNLSETAFILPSPKVDFRLRFFNRMGNEIPFSGHASVASLYLHAKQMGTGPCAFETSLGELKACLSQTAGSPPVVDLEMPTVRLTSPTFSLTQLQQALDVDPELLEPDRPLLLDQTQRHLFFSTASLESLGNLALDNCRAKAFALEHNLFLFAAVSANCFDPSYHLHSRIFAPAVDILEDPFTGAAQPGIVAFAQEVSLVPRQLKILKMEQGHFLNRPGKATVRVITAGSKYRLVATAKPVFSSSLTLE